MEKLVSQRETVFLGYSPQSQRHLFVNGISSPSSSSSWRSSDIDFSDVFGGPPRRVSVHEIRAVDHDDDDDEEDDNEKPVFGDHEGVGIHSRRYANEDFFGDIFKGKDLYSLSCSPRSKHERDLFSSVPGSRVLSPVRPSPPGADQQQLLVGGSSFPAQFSLPSTLINRTELPTFGSPARSQLKNKDSGSNVSSNYSHSPLSRLSSLANNNQAREVLENNVSIRTYLSKELSLSSEVSLELEKPEAKGKNNKLERELSSSDSDGPQVQGKDGQFHFSIYKWASKGSPMDMPLRAGKGLGSKEKGKLPRSSSFNGWLNGEEMVKRSPRVTPGDQSSGMQKDGFVADASVPSRVEQMYDVEEENLPLRKSESSRTHKVADMKPSNDVVAKNDGSKESKVKSIKHPVAGFDVGEDVKKRSDRSVNVDNGDVEKANVGDSERSLTSSIGKNKGAGKMKEFVKIFNKEPSGKPEVNVESQRQNSWRKEKGEPRTPDATTIAKPIRIGMESNSQSNDKVVDASILVDENPRRSENPKPEATSDSTNSNSTLGTTNLVSGTSLPGSDPDIWEAIFEESDDSSDDEFLIEEILQDDHELAEETSAKSEAEEVKAIDDKIRNWSRGKEGNIRSLLSTLQYVMWPGSGWKTVPLVDIVEGNALRKPYQKALLCLHPDKLQQKGATAHQKYIAEKVFDILQEAWTHFNSHGSV